MLELQHEGVMVDVLYDGQEYTHITGPLIQTENVHGTGCTLSTAIACELSKGYTVLQVSSRYPNTYPYLHFLYLTISLNLTLSFSSFSSSSLLVTRRYPLYLFTTICLITLNVATA